MDIKPELIFPALASILMSAAWLLKISVDALKGRQSQSAERPSIGDGESEWDVLRRVLVMMERSGQERETLKSQLEDVLNRLEDCHGKLAMRVADRVTKQLANGGAVHPLKPLSKTDRNKRNARIRQLKSEGWKYHDIAMEVGCSRSTISRVLSQS